MTIFSNSLNSHFPDDWLLCFVADDQSSQLEVLIDDLKRPFSTTGDGKRFESGLAYWGIGPTIAWQQACSDPLYPVAQASTREFSTALRNVSDKRGTAPSNYVSFGVGTGEKDAAVLAYFLEVNPYSDDFHYYPIDMSPSMLSIGIRGATRFTPIKHGMLIPIQMDFSNRSKLDGLRRMVGKIACEESVTFALLGNTLANFDDDQTLLQTLASVLRPQDRLLLEVAMTKEVSEPAAAEAATEYSRSNGFKRFATSALLRNTDLPIRDENVSFLGTVDNYSDALRIQVLYTSAEDRNLAFSVPDQQKVEFRRDDTIRLYLSRKYSPDAVSRLLTGAGLQANSHYQYDVGNSKKGSQRLFAMRLLLAAPTSAMVFLSYGHEDEAFVANIASLLGEVGLTTWVAKQDLRGVETLSGEITNALRLRRKVVVVLSGASMSREWVKAEIRIALEHEQRNPGVRSLFAIRLVDMDVVKRWSVLDADARELTDKLRSHLIYDFSEYQDDAQKSPDWIKLKTALIDRQE